MIHHTTTMDHERERIIRPRRNAAELRANLAELQRTARKILSGDYDPRPVGLRQLRQYGHHVPMLVALRSQVSYQRTRDLGHQLKMALYRGAEFETWVDRRQEMRIAHYATGLRRRRAAHTYRTI
jgi:hypothetical protein